jgi:hypothetical protein
LSEKDWCVIHGDLVFSNILADGLGNFLLIDPRGSYGREKTIFGDRYYDYAKITQSLFFRYDSIKRGNYLLQEKSKDNYDLFFPAESKIQKAWKKRFMVFCREQGLDLNRLRFFEISLLLSLLPLHQQDKKMVRVVLLMALKNLKSLISSNRL